jgi:8-oxo-dGTP pyrophosphatase MutT (NUDIX family)
MTGIRHFTASAIVFDYQNRVLVVHHNKIGQWLYPGGHIDPDEDPAQAALREVREETGVSAEVVSELLPRYPAVTVLAPPYAILEMPVSDLTIGTHRHINLVYVLRAASAQLTARREEVSAARWVHIADMGALDTPAELPSLVADAAQWARRN